MKILIVGGTGFIGRNLKEFFLTKKSFKIFYPTRQELNLFDDNACRDYLKKIKPDIVIHSAVDILSVENSLKIFFNIFNNHQFFGHLIQVGSGAEYDKRFYKPKMVENDFSLSVPIDTYGLAKFHIANVLETQKEKKYTNLRIFGIFGKYEDHSRRFISNNICRVLVGLPISLNRDMFFDYIWVQDFCLFIEKLIGFLPLKDISYNFCSGNPVSLLSLAKIIKTQMEVEGEIIIKDQVKNPEYSGDPKKIFNELEKFNFTDHKLAIENLINHYKKNLDQNRLKLFRESINE